MRAIVTLVILLVLVVGAFSAYYGHFPPPRQVIERLASRPDLGSKFLDPVGDRFDATVFLFTALLLTPIVALGAAAALAVVMMILAATIMPITHRVGVPDGLMFAMIAMTIGAVAYREAHLWVPKSLQIIALIARAYLITTA